MPAHIRLPALALCMVLGSLTTSHVYAQGRPQDFTTDASLLRFLDQLAEATYQFNIGNAAPYLALLSPSRELTLMGAAGGFEKGIDEIRPRVALITERRKQAAGFAENRAVIEYISIYQSGDLAYTVQIERRQLASNGPQATGTDVLRATHVLRRESGEWKLLHRQADPLVNLTVPELTAPRVK